VDLPLSLIAIAVAFLGLVFLVAAVTALARWRPLAFTLRTLLGLMLMAVAGLFAIIGVGTVGYQALTKEQVAAWVRVEPAGSERFTAKFRFPDGRTATYALAGNELYVDAHILKWKPIANLLGLHTQYELDRVAGRYRRLEDEQARVRTVYPLGRSKPLDMFDLRREFPTLAPLLDVEYGSASFVPADRSTEWELRVSTSGLLFRPAAASPNARDTVSRVPARPTGSASTPGDRA
jgi:hypothetical protein